MPGGLAPVRRSFPPQAILSHRNGNFCLPLRCEHAKTLENRAFPALARLVLRTAIMNVRSFQAAAALNANSRWQEVIPDNLQASSSVPGFRKQQLCVAARQAGLMPAGGLSPSGAAPMFCVPKATTSTSFQPGELKYTGANNDAAIEGKAFFEVQAPGGASAFTRDGEFHVSSIMARLVTKQGLCRSEHHRSDPARHLHNSSALFRLFPTGTVSQERDVRRASC